MRRLALLCACLAIARSPASTAEAGDSRENRFASIYNQWIAVRNAHPGTLNAREAELWREVKARFRELERSVRY